MSDDREKRRALRKEQRKLHDRIVSENQSAIMDTKEFNECRDQNNAIFRQLHHTREAINDSQNLSALAKIAKRHASFVDDVFRCYNYNVFSNNLRDKYRGEDGTSFSWKEFGQNIGVLFWRRSDISTMMGPIGKVAKERRVAVRQDKKHTKAVEPEELINAGNEDGKGDSGETEATNERIKNLFAVLREGGRGARTASGSNDSQTVDLVDMLVDRSDPVQTVENFFDFAFLVKEKRAIQQMQGDGIPHSLAVDPQKMNDEWGNKRRQMVLSMPIPAVREIAQDIDHLEGRPVGQNCPLHRDDPIYSANKIEDQVNLVEARTVSKVKPPKASRSNRRESTSASSTSSSSDVKRKAGDEAITISGQSSAKKAKLSSKNAGK